MRMLFGLLVGILIGFLFSMVVFNHNFIELLDLIQGLIG